MPWDGDTLETTVSDQLLGLLIETVMQVVAHATDKETVGITTLHIGEVVVLDTINELLYHDSGSHLRIVHVRQEDLGGVHTINDEGWNHLHLLTQEHAASVPH